VEDKVQNIDGTLEEAKRILIDLVYLSLQNNPVIGATARER
jgi:hypothetical protein